MRLTVLDTNVVVSAGIQPAGAPARLMMDWVLEGLVQVVVSSVIVDEYRRVVRRAKFARYGFPPSWLEFVLDEALLLPDPPAWPFALPDPMDAPFLALARQAGAWLVSGNLRHFPPAACADVRVLAPAEYLEVLLSSRQ